MNQKPSPPSSPASPECVIDRLFDVLLSMYGARWLDMWIGCDIDNVKAEWARALTGIDPDAMRLALGALLNGGKPFTPTLPEFVSLCRQFRKVGAPQLQLVDKRRGAGPPGGFQTLKDLLKHRK